MDRRSFLGVAALGGGAVLANLSSGSGAMGAGDDANVHQRPMPSKLAIETIMPTPVIWS